MKKVTNGIISKRKVAIIGGGFVGSSIAYALSIRGFAREIVLIDIAKEKIEGEAKDIQHGISSMGGSFVYAGDYADIADSELIIITAGRGRRPGETRLDLIKDNIVILENIVENIKKYYVNSTIMLVANPVDILVQKCAELMGLENGKVFGTGCFLDTSRLISVLANYTGLRNEVIKVDIIGEHGDTQLPVWSKATIAGVPIDEYCADIGLEWNETIKKEMEENVKTMGAQIISAKGKTHYGIATCVCYLADAILSQRPTICSVASPFHGEYGIKGVALSVPSIVGVNGVEARLETKFTDEELARLQASAKALKDLLDTLD